MTDPRLIKVYDETEPSARPGFFRAVPVAWKLEPPSGKVDEKTGLPKQSQPIAVQYAIVNKWDVQDGMSHDQGAWGQEFPTGWFVYGRTYIVGADGRPNERNIVELSTAGLWNGDVDALAGPPPEIAVIVELGYEQWQGKNSLRFKGVQADAAIPIVRGGGAFTPTDPELLALTRQRLGAQFKAIAGPKRPSGPGGGPPIAGVARVGAPAPGQPAHAAAPGPRPMPPRTPPPMTPAAPPAGFGAPADDSVPWDHKG